MINVYARTNPSWKRICFGTRSDRFRNVEHVAKAPPAPSVEVRLQRRLKELLGGVWVSTKTVSRFFVANLAISLHIRSIDKIPPRKDARAFQWEQLTKLRMNCVGLKKALGWRGRRVCSKAGSSPRKAQFNPPLAIIRRSRSEAAAKGKVPSFDFRYGFVSTISYTNKR